MDISRFIQQPNTVLLTTGWFGVPGGPPGGKVHLVTAADKRPVCHTHLHPQAEFQFCAQDIRWDYLECGKCRDVARAILAWREKQRAEREAAQQAREATLSPAQAAVLRTMVRYKCRVAMEVLEFASGRKRVIAFYSISAPLWSTVRAASVQTLIAKGLLQADAAPDATFRNAQWFTLTPVGQERAHLL